MIWLIGVPSAAAAACFAIASRSLSAAARSRPLSYFSPPKTLTIAMRADRLFQRMRQRAGAVLDHHAHALHAGG